MGKKPKRKTKPTKTKAVKIRYAQLAYTNKDRTLFSSWQNSYTPIKMGEDLND